MKNMLALAVVAVVAAAADAQSCRYVGTPVHQATYSTHVGYQYSTTYVPKKEVVVHDYGVAFPVLVPAFQYQFQPACSCPQPAQAAQGHVPGTPAVIPAAGLPTTPLAAAAPAPQAGIGQDHLKQLASLLLAEMRRQEEAVGFQDDGPPPAIDPLGAGVGHFPQRPIQPPPAQPGASAAAGLNAMATHCAVCHSGPSSKGGFVLFTGPGQFNQQADRQAILDSVLGQHGKSVMPPAGRPPMPQADRDAIVRFMTGQ